MKELISPTQSQRTYIPAAGHATSPVNRNKSNTELI